MKTGGILIVGGAGYIGSHVNKLLSEQGFRTVVFDNLSTGYKKLVKWGEFYLGDLADLKRIKACFKKYRPSAVMHFGACISVGESVEAPALYYRNNLVNTVNLLDAALEYGAPPFVFSSTAAVYGYPKTPKVTETTALNPINPYGRTKKMVEEILADYDRAYGLRSVRLRYFNAAGADPDSETGSLHPKETNLIPVALAAASGEKAVRVFGGDYPTPDGTCLRDYIHVSDLASAHVLALKYLRGGGKSEVFNLGNGNGFSVKQVLAAAEKVIGKSIKAVPAPRRPGDPAILVADASKACKALGWRPEHPKLEDIIETAWRWHKKNL